MKKCNKSKIITATIILIFDLFSIQARGSESQVGGIRNIKEDQIKSFEVSPVSIVTTNNKAKYFIIDYVNIYLFNEQDNTIFLPKINGLQKKLNPAGMFYNKLTKKLYIANYTIQNVLIFDYNEADDSLTFTQSIESEYFKGPEGVYVVDNQLLIADYDANLVFLYDLSQGNPKMIWKTIIKQPHSIIKLNGEIFATSLTDRKIYKLNQQGEIKASTESGIGNIPPHHLWPTHLFITHENELGVVDAHQGTVSIYDQSLKLKSYFGKNGPYDFNFPYTVNPTEFGYVMANTFRRAINFFDKDFNILRAVNLSKLTKKHILKSEWKQIGKIETPYVYDFPNNSRELLKRYSIGKITNLNAIYPSYNALVELHYNIFSKVLKIDSINHLYTPLYRNFYITGVQVIRHKDNTYYILYSPQNTFPILIDPRTWAVAYPQLNFQDFWGEEIAEELLKHPHSIEQLDEINNLIKQGHPRIDSYNKVILKGFTEEKIWNYWDTALSFANTTQDFKKKIILNKFNQEDINKYILSCLDDKDIYLIETFFISYLLGNSIFENIANISLSTELIFQPRHELSTAVNYHSQNRFEDIYAAEIEGQKEDHKFSIKGNLSSGWLYIDWLLGEEPDSLVLIIYDDNDKKIGIINTTTVNKVDLSDSKYSAAARIDINCHYAWYSLFKQKRLLIKRVLFLKNIQLDNNKVK